MKITFILLGLLVLVTIFFIVYYFIYKEDEVITISNNDKPLLINTIQINKKRIPLKKQKKKKTVVINMVPEIILEKRRPNVIPEVILQFTPEAIPEAIPEVVRRNRRRRRLLNRRPNIVYRNENQLMMDPNDQCYIKYKNRNNKYTGYIDFNTEQKCEYEDVDEEDFYNKINLYPNVKGYVDNGKIVDDLIKRDLKEHSWADGDITNYYPEFRMNEERNMLTDNDKVIYQFQGFYNSMI